MASGLFFLISCDLHIGMYMHRTLQKDGARPLALRIRRAPRWEGRWSERGTITKAYLMRAVMRAPEKHSPRQSVTYCSFKAAKRSVLLPCLSWRLSYPHTYSETQPARQADVRPVLPILPCYSSRALHQAKVWTPPRPSAPYHQSLRRGRGLISERFWLVLLASFTSKQKCLHSQSALWTLNSQKEFSSRWSGSF